MNATIHYGLPFDDYAAIPAWNWSKLKAATRSARALRYTAFDAEDEDTTSRKKNRGVHALVLEPVTFCDEFIVMPEHLDHRGRKPYKDFLSEHGNDRTDIKHDEYIQIRDTADAYLTALATIMDRAARVDTELTITWQDEATGIWYKARLDMLIEHQDGTFTIVDLKTGGTISPREVASMIARNQWHGQAAHYIEAACAALDTDVEAIRYVIAAAQGKAEQDAAIFELSETFLLSGHLLHEQCVTTLHESLRTGTWPGALPGGPHLLDPPTWALPDEGPDADDIFIGGE